MSLGRIIRFVASTQMVGGIGLACCYGYLAWLSKTDPQPCLLEFGWLIMLSFILYAWVYFVSDESKLGAKAILFWAASFRLMGVWGEPLFEDDFFRYLWDGYRFAVDGSPYGRPPEAYFSDSTVPHSFQPILGQINHPDIPTIYGPTFEYLFLLAYTIASGQLWSLKCLLIGGDLVLVFLLIRLAGPRNSMLYAWNPLVIKEIAFTAHPDGLIALLLLAAWCLGRQGRQALAGLLLAMAVTCKASIWLIVPFLLIGLGLGGASVFAGSYLLIYLPFYWQGASDLAGLQAFAGGFEFNSVFYGLVRLALSPFWSKAVLGSVLLLWVGFYFVNYRRAGPGRELPRGDWLFGGLLLVSPVINPWYLLWLLPYACVYPSVTAWTSSAALLLAYVTGLNLQGSTLLPYEHPGWLRPLEFGIVGLALIVDLVRHRWPISVAKQI